LKKLQNRRQEFKGSITVFFSLIFVLFLSLIGAMVQSASIQVAKSVKVAEMSLALENLFAEYDTKMLEKYELFVRTGNKKWEVFERLKFYGIVGMDHEIISSTLLTDGAGHEFYEQAIKSMGGKVEETDSSVEELLQETDEEANLNLDELLEREEQELPEENNPIEAVNILKKANLLSLVYPEPEKLSEKSVTLETLASHRSLEAGVNYDLKEVNESAINRALFGSYLSEHFKNVLSPAKDCPLVYEQEYLLSGKSSDQENLKETVKQILSIRVAINYAYILTDQAKQAEAGAMALGLSSLLTAPGAAEIVKQAILFAWAYGESIVDLRVLLKGEKVPLIKSVDTWQLQLTNIFQLQSERNVGEGKFSEGISYQEYLNVLLIAEKREDLCMRALDLIELNTGVRVDDCIIMLQIKSECQLQGGIPYEISTKYGYK